MKLVYKTQTLNTSYRTDFVCYRQVLVELKALRELTDEHRAQVHNYLKAGGLKLGLLINFGHYPKLQHERIVR